MAPPPLSAPNLSEMEKEYLCHDFENNAEEIGLVESLGGLYLLASQKPRLAHHPATWSLMLINLLPDFFAVHNSTDRVAAYLRYFENHRRFLEAYWHNYVLDPAGPHFLEVVRSAALASRVDLRTMLERIDVVSLARNTEEQCRTLFVVEPDMSGGVMVGVGAPHPCCLAGQATGVPCVCREH